MKAWDKPDYQKKKEFDRESAEYEQLVKDAELGKKIKSFLYGGHRGRIDWPDDKLYIGVGFEYDCHEDYGYGVFYRMDDGTLELLAKGRTLDKALDNATKYFRSKLDADNQSSEK